MICFVQVISTAASGAFRLRREPERLSLETLPDTNAQQADQGRIRDVKLRALGPRNTGPSDLERVAVASPLDLKIREGPDAARWGACRRARQRSTTRVP